jgi:PAT family beta-lactamase induction signal transducer AmpG
MAVLLGLGFASGLPLMLTSRTLNVWARDQRVDLTTIGLFSLLGLPYAYKFLWAPAIDALPLPILGRRRGWLLVTQLALIGALAGMALTGPTSAGSGLLGFAICGFAVAFFSATQDIAADAYRTDVLTASELGPGASVYMTGYRAAMLLASAGAVALAEYLQWKWVYFIVAGLMLPGVLATLLAHEPQTAATPNSFVEAVIEPLREFLARNRMKAVLVVLFILLFKLPDYMAQRMTDPLLLDLGFTKQQIAFWALGVGIAVTIPGVLVGGPLIAAVGLRRGLLIVGIAQALSNAGYLILANVGANRTAMMFAVGIEYFCTGLVAAGFVAFLMSQCNRRFSATQYALLSSVMGLSNALGGLPTGWLVERLRYPAFFLITMMVAIPGLLMIPFLPARNEITDAKSTAASSA